MILETLVVGPIATNCYLVGKGPAVAIIDPGGSPDAICGALDQRGLIPEKIVVTHAHADHILAVGEISEKYGGLPIVCHRSEASFLTNPQENLSVFLGEELIVPEATEFADDGDTIDLGGLEFTVLHVPGHSPGGICLYHAPADGVPVLIAGDTVFAESIGRTDFPHSDHNTFISKIKEKILTLPPETTILPGHGPITTVEREKAYNPFLQ
jgi:glyoxylase-like metal-dependent hydrolase (beta-lactamase superfamily II)